MENENPAWKVHVSNFALRTFNPIRHIVENMKIEPNSDKPMIALSLGDPTVFGNLSTPKIAEQAVINAVKDGRHNGYVPSVGAEVSRQAVAEYVSTATSSVEAKDVILCSGCSGALDLCITVMAEPGQNVLIPRPGFSIYKTLAESIGIEIKMYNLLPEMSWEIDLGHLESQIDDKTAAVIINNPSNPCGSVYGSQHLKDFLSVILRHKVPVIADEIYEHFVFEGFQYHSVASLTSEVPVLSCGGLTKRFLVPGWRLGWIVVNDRNNVLSEVRQGLHSLSQRILGPNTLVQAALPDILSSTPTEFFHDTVAFIQKNAALFYSELRKVAGLTPVMPQGAMYMMVGIDLPAFPQFNSEIEFTEALVAEQSVFVLPGTLIGSKSMMMVLCHEHMAPPPQVFCRHLSDNVMQPFLSRQCFNGPGYVRIVLTVPASKALEACHRIRQFCHLHYTPLDDDRSADVVADGKC